MEDIRVGQKHTEVVEETKEKLETGAKGGKKVERGGRKMDRRRQTDRKRDMETIGIYR